MPRCGPEHAKGTVLTKRGGEVHKRKVLSISHLEYGIWLREFVRHLHVGPRRAVTTRAERGKHEIIRAARPCRAVSAASESRVLKWPFESSVD